MFVREKPNTVQLIDSNGTMVYTTAYGGPPVDGDIRPADHPEVTEPYIAYSPNASVQVRPIFTSIGPFKAFGYVL